MPANPKQSLQPEGTIYVTSMGRTFETPRIDAERILKYQDNIYLAGALDKQQRTLFKDKKEFMVKGLDPNGEVDQDLTNSLTNMCKKPEVDLWFNLQIAWRESATWGPAIFNPVWGYEGSEYKLLKLRHLPSETFSKRGMSYSQVTNPILPGICLGPDEEMEFWQTQIDGMVKQIKNVVMITDPVRGGVIGGKPLILPALPIVTMLDFSWKGQMQQNNRLGAGGLFFVKVINPRGDDKVYAQSIIKNISRGVGYQLRENMEIVNLGLSQTSTALDTISALDKLLSDYFSPSSSISKDGTLIGGSSTPEYDLYMSYIQGQQAWVESAFERLLDPYLLKNGYTDYSIVVDIPEPTVDKSELWMKLVTTGFDTQTLSLKDRRAILSSTAKAAGVDLEELDEVGEEALLKQFGRGSGQSDALALQRAGLVADVAKIDELDPFLNIDKTTQRKVYLNALGIEEGRSE